MSASIGPAKNNFFFFFVPRGLKCKLALRKLQSLMFVNLFIGAICKAPQMSGGESEERRFPLIDSPFPFLLSSFPTRSLSLPLPVQC